MLWLLPAQHRGGCNIMWIELDMAVIPQQQQHRDSSTLRLSAFVVWTEDASSQTVYSCWQRTRGKAAATTLLLLRQELGANESLAHHMPHEQLRRQLLFQAAAVLPCTQPQCSCCMCENSSATALLLTCYIREQRTG
jgi:hypothetical protein